MEETRATPTEPVLSTEEVLERAKEILAHYLTDFEELAK